MEARSSVCASLILASVLSIFFLMPGSSAHIVSSEGDFYYFTLLHFPPSDLPVAGQNTEIHVTIFNTSTGDPQSNLDVVHERVMHVFVVGKDLETFAHTHPEDSTDGLEDSNSGTYKLDYTFPKAGVYTIIVDYTIGGRNIIKSFLFDVTGEEKMSRSDTELSRAGSFGGYDVTLVAPESINVGEDVQLDFHIEKEGAPVTNLQQYLGSEIHLALVSSDLKTVGHTHSYVPTHTMHVGSMSQRYFGPDVPVRYTFTTSGTYVLFGQFQHEGEVVTTRFVVKVGESVEYQIIVVLIYVGIAALGAYVFRDYIRRMLKKNRRPKSR